MAKDFFHHIVREALEKDGWLITHDPYKLTILESKSEIDIGAEKLFAAERANQKIAIEVKSFLSLSFGYEFHSALGQYLNYIKLLYLQEPDRILFLAVAKHIYDEHFTKPVTDYVLTEYKVKIIVFDALSNQIERWIEK
jgi:XisH protein